MIIRYPDKCMGFLSHDPVMAYVNGMWCWESKFQIVFVSSMSTWHVTLFGRRDNIGNLLADPYGFPFVTTLLQCTGNAKIWKKRIRALAHSSSVNGRYDDSLDCVSAWRILSIVFAFYRILVQYFGSLIGYSSVISTFSFSLPSKRVSSNYITQCN